MMVNTSTAYAVTSLSQAAGERAASSMAGAARAYSSATPMNTSRTVPTACRRLLRALPGRQSRPETFGETGRRGSQMRGVQRKVGIRDSGADRAAAQMVLQVSLLLRR